MTVEAFRRSFLGGQALGPGARKRHFANTLKIKVSGYGDAEGEALVETVRVHTFELLRESYGYSGRVGFWVELEKDEVDPWLEVTSVDLVMDSPEPDGAITEILSIHGACVTKQLRKSHAGVNEGKTTTRLGSTNFWEEFAEGSPVGAILARESRKSSSDVVRLAVSLSFVDAFAYQGKAHFPADIYTGESMRNVFLANSLPLTSETTADPDWLAPATIAPSSHICVPLSGGDASFYDYVMSVVDDHASSIYFDYETETFAISETAPTSDAVDFNLLCDSEVTVLERGSPASATVQNVSAVGCSYQQLGTSRALQVPRRAVAGRWTESQTTDVAAAESTRQIWRSTNKEYTDLGIREFPRDAVLPTPTAFYKRLKQEYQCREVAIWLGAVEPDSPGQADGLWSKAQDRGLRYEGNVSLRSLKKSTDDDDNEVTDYLGVAPYNAPRFPIQVEGVVRPSSEVTSWLDSAKQYDGEFENSYDNLFVDDRTYLDSTQAEGWHSIDTTTTTFAKQEPEAPADDGPYERDWMLSIPTWNIQLLVPYQPDLNGGHLFHTPLVGTTVLIDVYRESAEISRYLSWGPDVEMPDQASGGHMLFGVPGYANSQLSYRHDGSGKPVLDLGRRNKDDYQEITLKEGQLIIKLTTDIDGP